MATWLSCYWFLLTWSLRLDRAERVLCDYRYMSLLGMASDFYSVTSTKALSVFSLYVTNSPINHVDIILESDYHFSVTLFQRHLRVGLGMCVFYFSYCSSISLYFLLSFPSPHPCLCLSLSSIVRVLLGSK